MGRRSSGGRIFVPLLNFKKNLCFKYTTSSTAVSVSTLASSSERDLQTLLPEVTDSTDFLALHEPISGSCRLRLEFPNTHYVILTTPNHGNLAGCYIELSFVARVVTYIAILGFIVIVVFLILKYLGACEGENTIMDTEVTEVRQVTETDPIMPAKPIPYTYGTGEEDDDSRDNSFSEEPYDAKLCVICYDEQRNCFFVPCGHCATCYDCAQRIMEGENKVCPICRRLIHKLRRLFHS
ncbi:hypothetical protein CMV_010311 [Castanea mollissima]|uniref:RING-type domain-containing protein n=1 Tax=Castanea mollissima TaxID=60419 RepID=A0A8J4R5M5_9ROSI|nr:hypothetical protein CMV_010311 [Castanea mollissima]